MLRSLQIENYAIIRSLKINFDEGFTAITGETGAGKSIIIGALSLILGNRADTSVLHDHSKKCFIEGVFDVDRLHLENLFEENDLDYQNPTYIRREVNENGKSRAFVNDTPVNLNTLKTIAEQLVDIHSQHHNLLVNDEDFRTKILDQYANTVTLLEKYRQVYAAYKKTDKTFHQLSELQAKREQERSYLAYVSQELQDAHLVAGEQEEAEQQIAILSHADQIKTKLYSSLQMLSEEESNNVLLLLRYITDDCQSIADYDPDIADLKQRLNSSIIELKDIAEELSRKKDSVEVNPAELARFNERLDFIIGLQHKHHKDSVEALLALQADTDNQLAAFTTDSEAMEKADKERQQLYEKALKLAHQLSEKRSKAISPFEEEMVSKIRLLGMEYGQFKIEMTSDDNMGDNGIDRVRFLFSANRGSALNEVEKTASGGEMSRLMLAIKSIINDNSLLPTVIFDEIDTGISGETAGKVATMMKQFSQHHQLIVITHLPQIAAKGHAHFFVYKNNEGEKTHTEIRSLSQIESIREIAQMMSGENVSEAAIAAAKELKKQ